MNASVSRPPATTPSFDRTDASRYAPYALALLRIVSGYLFLLHAGSKLFGVPHVAMFDGLDPMSLIGVAGVIELVGGALMVIGWQTRIVAFVLSGEMAAAYFIGHASQGSPLVPILNGGEAAVLFCFSYLVLATLGGGAWSVDSMRSRA